MYPAFYFSTIFLLGTFLRQTLCVEIFLITAIILFYLSYEIIKERKFKKILIIIFIFIFSLIYSFTVVNLPKDQEFEGEALFKPLVVSRQEGPLGNVWVYKGKIKKLKINGEMSNYRNIPISIYLKSNNRPIANSCYWIKGTGKSGRGLNYIFKLNPKDQWIKVEKTKSNAELRYQCKSKVLSYLKSKIKDKKTFLLLSGLSTGEFSDKFFAILFQG